MAITQSADLPVRPFGAEPAEPAPAVRGAPPDAPAAAPAFALVWLAGLSILCLGTPVAATGSPQTAKRHAPCPIRHRHASPAPVAPKPAAPQRSTSLSGGVGGLRIWEGIAADLMP